MKFKRIFLLIIDSLGVGETLDAVNFGDSGANTLGHVLENSDLFIPNLKKIGFLDTLNMSENDDVDAYYTIVKPASPSKDTLNAHYEMFGINNSIPLKTFNNGFTYDILNAIEQITGRSIIGNVCCNDDSIIEELGERQYNYGSLIVYTSSDSDIQIAAHEDSIPIATLHEYCERIRSLIQKLDWKIARVIARPFNGTPGNYKFVNSGRRDYTLKPPKRSVLDALNEANYNVIGIGKINDLFDGVGINKNIKATNNNEAINKLTDIIDKSFTGVCITNLCDFDSLYGTVRDVEGYAKAIEELDVDIPIILNKLELDDLLIITSDHGKDPTFGDGNQHTRENLPLILYSRNFKKPGRLPQLETLADIGALIADNFDLPELEIGKSILDELE